MARPRMAGRSHDGVDLQHRRDDWTEALEVRMHSDGFTVCRRHRSLGRCATHHPACRSVRGGVWIAAAGAVSAADVQLHFAWRAARPAGARQLPSRGAAVAGGSADGAVGEPARRLFHRPRRTRALFGRRVASGSGRRRRMAPWGETVLADGRRRCGHADQSLWHRDVADGGACAWQPIHAQRGQGLAAALVGDAGAVAFGALGRRALCCRGRDGSRPDGRSGGRAARGRSAVGRGGGDDDACGISLSAQHGVGRNERSADRWRIVSRYRAHRVPTLAGLWRRGVLRAISRCSRSPAQWRSAVECFRAASHRIAPIRRRRWLL